MHSSLSTTGVNHFSGFFYFRFARCISFLKKQSKKLSLFNNFCCINNMLSIRFFLDNILPAARKQRFRKASKGSFDTPSVKSKKGFCAGKKRNVLRWKRHFPLRKGKTFPTDKENPVFCKRGFPILREKRQSERVVDTEVEI